MWIAASRGLLRWSAAAGLEPVEDPRFREQLVAAVTAGGGGRTWAAVPGVGLLVQDGGRWRQIESVGLVAVGAIRTLALASEGRLLVGGESGLVEVDTVSPAAAVRPVTRSWGRRPISSLLVAGDELWVGVGRELRTYRRQGDGWMPAERLLDKGRIRCDRLDGDGGPGSPKGGTMARPGYPGPGLLRRPRSRIWKRSNGHSSTSSMTPTSRRSILTSLPGIPAVQYVPPHGRYSLDIFTRPVSNRRVLWERGL